MSSQEIISKALTLTNEYRVAHNAPPLQWSPSLQQLATDYATHLATRNLPLVEKTGVPYGQNMFHLNNQIMFKTRDLEVVDLAIKFWYERILQYDWSHQGTCGLSFTQLVWKGITHMGLAVAHSLDKKRTIVVCFYDPHGNVEGEFSTNVEKLSSLFPQFAPREGLSPKFERNPQFSANSRFSLDHFKVNTASNILTDKLDSIDSGQVTDLTSGLSSLEITESESGAFSVVQRAAHELHNQLRSKHGASSLKLDEKLCQNAQLDAQSILNGQKPVAVSGAVEVGQNVYHVTGKYGAQNSVAVVKMAVQKWYDHCKDYNWRTPLASKGYANLFSQVVWNSSEQLGVGVVSRDDLTIVVCLYSPKGNLAQDQMYKENVFPLK